ncbi:MAG: YciI family protein [Vicinamibacterales bacterium]
MYAIAVIRYRRPVEEVVVHQDPHRAYLRGLKEAGTLLAAGPMDPRSGGMLLLRVPDDNVLPALNAIRDNDPYVQHHVAQYELIPWAPVMGKEDLDRL